ncbi:DUF3857 domain-containing protein [Winogradskyella endarachnes]|uniref:DUF3857 domain-containing protein n=1 Tax=Winogradskyella endarachnes TaxID=2681965 RepID=A0A6L6UA99_9FLAO|nr:DUF3857 domain-containing protein [Winogradskyella endarachnes]MUU77842.1 DUF3857 domain-containing protein [Winogradskyella endarachnes]
MNKIILALLICFGVINVIKAQINEEANNNFEKSKYEEISNEEKSDATIIYDRTYIDVGKIRENGEFKVRNLKTIHRKIKINTLYGLEQYNKLYIKIFNDLHYNLDYVDCKVKTLKKDGKVVKTDNTDFITTTLPANAPFFYKQKGNVKMLAIKDINIGDQVEYIFTTQEIIDIDPEYYYKTDRLSFVNNDFCIEKSVFINADKYKIKLWPHYFGEKDARNTDYSYNEGKKITLNNIKPKYNEIYSNSFLYEPDLTYMIKKEITVKDDTWEDFAKYFKPSRKKTKKKFIFEGKSINDAITEIETIVGTKEKFKFILKQINEPLENNMYLYFDLDDKIDISWSYAQVISRAVKKMKIPINFHFVINKNYNKLDKTYVSLYQFDDIICSFKGEDNKIYYFPLFSPFSNLNDIQKEFQGTECFTISQNELGERTHSFDNIPEFNSGKIAKNIDVNLGEIEEDKIKLNIKEKLSYSGHSWINNKALLMYLVKDSTRTDENLKRFVKEQLPMSHKIDSIYNVQFTSKDASCNIQYEYDKELNINNASEIIHLRPSDFVQHTFYTPYHMRETRLEKGYLNNEYNLDFVINFHLKDAFYWIQNDNLRKEIKNDFGELKTNFSNDSLTISTSFNFEFKKNQFEVSEWNQILDLRDTANDYLVQKFYFKK